MKIKSEKYLGLQTILIIGVFPGGHSHMEVTEMCGQDPRGRGLSVID